MKNNLIQLICSFAFVIFNGCNADSETDDKKISVNYKTGTISVEDYSVKAGKVSDNIVEAGLTSILQNLGEAIETEIKPGGNLKGSLVCTFRCEPDGMVRWIASGESSFSKGNGRDISDQLTAYLMKKQTRFGQLNDYAMIEAKFKFE